MTPEEFGNIAMALRTYYPKENIIPNKQAMTLWYEQMCDLDYKVVELSLKKWVATNKWSPSIAELRELAASFANPEIKDWSEAWESAREAVRRFGSYNPQEAYASLDELTCETVKRIGYYDLCRSENHDADRANFRMIYETLAKRKKTEQQVSPEISKAIEQLSQKLIAVKEE